MRVCVCISGQLRSPTESLKYLRDFTAGSDVTVLFSLWDKIGRKLDGALNIDQMPRIFERDAYICIPRSQFGFNRLWEFLPELRRRLDPSLHGSQQDLIRDLVRQSFPDAIVDLESSDLLDLGFDESVEDGNSKRMTYKIWRVNEMKRKLERTAGKFDVVVRMRPDLQFDHLSLQQVIEIITRGNMVVTGWNTETIWIDDVFAAGPSKEMDIYSAIFARTIALPQAWTLIHKDLHYHVRDIGLPVQNAPSPYRFAADPLITLEELRSSLEVMRKAADGWSPLHEMVWNVSSVLSIRESNGSAEALKALQQQGASVVQAGLDVSSPFFVAACDLLNDLDQLKPAAVCALALAAWQGQTWEISRKIASAAFVKAIDQYIAHERTPLSGFPAWLLQDSSQAWLLDLLGEALPSSPLLAWIGQKFELTLEDPHVMREIVATLIRHNDRDRLSELISSFHFGPDDNPDVVALRRDSLLRAYEALGQSEDSLREMRHAADLSPGNIELLYQLAHKLKRVGLYTEAKDVQMRAVQAAPKHAGANRQLAEICLCLQETALGLEYARTADALDSTVLSRVLLAFAEASAGSGMHELSVDHATIESIQHTDFPKIPGFSAFLRQDGA